MDMTLAEAKRVDKLRLGGKTPWEALALLNRSRALRGIAPVSRTAIYEYCAGKTHKRDHPENRGRRAVPLRNLKVYDAVRKSDPTHSARGALPVWKILRVTGKTASKPAYPCCW